MPFNSKAALLVRCVGETLLATMCAYVALTAGGVVGRYRQMNTVTEELIATEMIFDNLLTNLPPEEAVALLSCMLFEEKTENEPLLTPQYVDSARSHMI